MKLITRDTDYGLRAICCIARHKERIVPAAELVKQLGIPRPFLRKILQLLNAKGILKSYKGPKGGFVLSRPAARISLLDLIKIFQGPLQLNECLFKKSTCPRVSTCALRKKIKAIEKYVIRELKPISIATLLEGR